MTNINTLTVSWLTPPIVDISNNDVIITILERDVAFLNDTLW